MGKAFLCRDFSENYTRMLFLFRRHGSDCPFIALSMYQFEIYVGVFVARVLIIKSNDSVGKVQAKLT